MSARLRAPHRLAAALGAVLLSTVVLSSCSDDGDSATDPGDTGDTASAEASTTTCVYPSDGSQPAKEVDPPAEDAPDTGDVSAEITTGAGVIDVTLDREATPCTVNSFVSLAEQGYFDDTQCHRITTQGIFVLQCGDPTASGAGGPGYSFDDELSGEETYPAGTLAMANAGANTNGSQFFIVYDDTQLSPAYAVFGQVGAEGLDVVKAIAKKGAQGGAPDGPPAEEVTIEGVTVG